MFSKNLFVVGCGHSGTSIMTRILGQHPYIYSIPGETGVFCSSLIDCDIELRLGEFDKLMERNGKKMWVEKTPLHINFLDDIFRLRRNSRVIIMMRDPRDVACSYRSRGFTFEVGIQKWIKAYGDMHKSGSDKRVYVMKLEDLVSNTDMQLAQLMIFLKLPCVNLLDYYKEKVDWYAGKTVESRPKDGLGENHEVLRNWQINQPLFSSTKRYDEEMGAEDRGLMVLFGCFSQQYLVN